MCSSSYIVSFAGFYTTRIVAQMALTQRSRFSLARQRMALLLGFGILLFPSAIRAAAIDWAQVHTTTMQAIDALYNLRYNEAEQYCNDVIAAAPRDPRGHFFKAMVYYRRHNTSRDDADYKKFIHYSERTVKVCEALIENNEQDSKALFYMGGILGYRGLARYFKDDVTGALWDGKKGYNYLERAIEADSTNTDASMGFGLMNYLTSQAPAFIKPALKLAGMSGNRVKGLRQLELAAAKGVYTRSEAMTWLSGFYADEQNFVRCRKHSMALLTRHPNNYWQRLQFAQILLYSMREAAEAAEQFRTLLLVEKPENTQDFEKASAWAHFGMGTASMYRNAMADARQHFERCLGFDAAQQHAGALHYYIGLCYELEGKRTEAVQQYKQAPNQPEAQQLLNAPMTSDDIAAHRIGNLQRAGDYQQLYGEARVLLTRTPSLPNHNKGYVLYVIACAYQEEKTYDKARECFQQVLELQLTKDMWLLPFASYRLGQVFLKQNNKESAKLALERALDYEDYDNEERLRKQVERELDRL